MLRSDIEEARLSDVSIRGDAGLHRERLERLGAELAAGRVLWRHDLQATLLHMRELPGLSMTAVTVRHAEEPRAYRLELDADFGTIGGAVRLSNRGTEEIGPNFVLGQVVANGLPGGRTTAGFLFGAATDYDEYHGLGLLGSSSIDGRTTLSASGLRSRADPHETDVERDIHYVRDRVSIRFQRRLRVEDGRKWSLAAALEGDDLGIARSGEALRDERLRLPYAERCKLGGDRLGRGFKIPEIAGDQGVGAKLEVRRRLSRAVAWLGRPSFYGFYDVAAAWKQDVPGRESAATAEVGFAVQRPRMSAQIEVAQPLTRADIEGRDGPSVFFELTQRL